MNAEPKSEAEAVAEIALRSAEPKLIKLERGDAQKLTVLVHQRDLTVSDLKPHFDRYLDAPERRKGTAQLTTLQSFVSHVNRFKDEHSAIFANSQTSSPALLAVLDYHRQGADGVPGFGEHRSRYQFPTSDEWAAWLANDNAQMTQADFAEFIEERLPDVADPTKAGENAKAVLENLKLEFASPSRLLQLSKGLAIRVDQRVANNVRLETGEGHIQFHEAHTDDAGAPLKVPGAFLLGIPCFKMGTPYQVPVRLRYKVHGQRIHWSYKLYNAERIIDHAITESIGRVEELTALPVFRGTPE